MSQMNEDRLESELRTMVKRVDRLHMIYGLLLIAAFSLGRAI